MPRYTPFCRVKVMGNKTKDIVKKLKFTMQRGEK